jgi:hypothetical protein
VWLGADTTGSEIRTVWWLGDVWLGADTTGSEIRRVRWLGGVARCRHHWERDPDSVVAG